MRTHTLSRARTRARALSQNSLSHYLCLDVSMRVYLSLYHSVYVCVPVFL